MLTRGRFSLRRGNCNDPYLLCVWCHVQVIQSNQFVMLCVWFVQRMPYISLGAARVCQSLSVFQFVSLCCVVLFTPLLCSFTIHTLRLAAYWSINETFLWSTVGVYCMISVCRHVCVCVWERETSHDVCARENSQWKYETDLHDIIYTRTYSSKLSQSCLEGVLFNK